MPTYCNVLLLGCLLCEIYFLCRTFRRRVSRRVEDVSAPPPADDKEVAPCVRCELLSGTDSDGNDSAEPAVEPDVYDEYAAYEAELLGRTSVADTSAVPSEDTATKQNDLLTLLTVFSKGAAASPEQVAGARRALRNISGSEVEQTLLDSLEGADGRVSALLDALVKEDMPSSEGESAPTDFRLSDYV